MLKSYLRIAVRNLFRQKAFSFVNILGLSIGITCFMLIGLSVQSQLTYDDFHEKGDRIYRLTRTLGLEQGPYVRGDTGARLAALLKTECPEIEETVRFGRWGGEVQSGDRKFEEWLFLFADPSVFDVFSFPLVQGDPKTALSMPFSVLLTPQTAKRYFGNENPIGQVLSYRNKTSSQNYDFMVTGIIEVPKNSHIRLNFLASMNTLHHVDFVNKRYFTQWPAQAWTYVLLREGTDAKSLTDQLPAFVERHVNKRSASWITMDLEPLNRIYLYSKGDSKLSGDLGSIDLLYVLSSLGIVILGIACINFVNLATARSNSRAKEVGLRKVLGSRRSHLMRQFLTESMLMSVLALALSLMLLELIGGLQWQLKFDLTDMIIFGCTTVLIVGLINGIYPALLLSSFNPVEALRGRLRTGSASGFRKVSVVFQFVISMLLIIVTLVGFQQVRHERYKDLGVDLNNLIALEMGHKSVREKYDAFRTELLKDPRIDNVTASSSQVGIKYGGELQIRGDGLKGYRSIAVIWINPNFVNTTNLSLMEGRDVSEGQIFLFNQKALEEFEWPSATGKTIELFIKQQNKDRVVHTGTVAGVVNDFQFHMYLNIRPLVLVLDPNRAHHILIRTHPDHMRAVLPHIETLWHQWFPDRKFEHSFLGEKRDNQYQTFEIIVSLFSTINILAIFIACLGLFGLTAFTVDCRIKEIGIRKVMGASVLNITTLLSKEFVYWISIAAVIACPIAYVGIDFLLNKLPTRAAQSPLSYIAAILIAFVLALMTVNMLAIRAARSNPVEALRTE